MEPPSNFRERYSAQRKLINKSFTLCLCINTTRLYCISTMIKFVPLALHNGAERSAKDRHPKSNSIQHQEREEETNNVKVEAVLSQLSDEEIEIAARASYEYLKNPVESQKLLFAKRIIRRYLISKRGKVDSATNKLKSTLKFRKDMQVDKIMKAFDDIEDDDYAKPLQKQLSSKKFFVQGFDRGGSSILFFVPRLVNGHDHEWTLKEAIYSIERAIACSRACDHSITAVVDFSGFSLTRHAPPLDIGKQFLTTLRNHYAGQIHSIVLLDTPPTFSFFWNLFLPFIGTSTKKKIHFVSGKKAKRKLEENFSLKQVPSWMIPGGKKNRPLDLEEYLFQTPFNKAFDDG